MKIIRLEDRNEELFWDMDPLLMTSWAGLGRSFALAAFTRDEQTGGDIPAGIVVCTQRDDALIILWMCVKSSFRGRGLGDELFGKVVEMARGGGMEQIGAYFNDAYGRREICAGEKIYFREHGLKREVPLHGEWVTDIRTLHAQPYFAEEAGESSSAVSSLWQMKSAQVRKYMQDLTDNDKAAKLFPLNGTWAKPEEEISFLLLNENRELTGAILVEKVDEELIPVCFYVQSGKDERKLLATSLAAAEKKYGGIMGVHVILTGDACENLMLRILPQERIANTLLMSDTVELAVGERVYNPYVQLPPDREEVSVRDMAGIRIKQGEDLEVTLGCLLELPVAKGTPSGQVIPSGSVTLREFYGALMACRYYGHLGLLPEDGLPPSVEWFEQEVSCCIREDGRLLGIFLVHRTEDGKLMPVLLFARSKTGKELIELLRFAILSAGQYYPSETKVILRRHDAASRKLIEKIIND